MSAQVIPVIVEQHAEEAAFLWSLRDAAVHAPHYSLKDLSGLDDRVEAHLDGLRIAGDEGWSFCEQGLAWEEAGEVFAAAVLAFESGDGKRIEAVINTGCTNRGAFRGLISSLGWLPKNLAIDWIRRLLTANALVHRLLGVAGCAINRYDPGQALLEALNDPDQVLQSRALRTIGELKRRDLMPLLRQRYQSKDDVIRFWSCWSGLLIGDRSALQPVSAFIYRDTPFRERAMQLALRVMDAQNAQNLFKSMVGNNELHRLVLIGVGIQGVPLYIPSLINKMKVPELARVAGEAFSMITGVDLAYEDLEGEWPKGFEVGPSENPEDEDVTLDPDEDLPWPNPSLIHDWWKKNEGRFRIGTRYLCGQPITIETCQRALSSGFQRQRMAASLELALMRPEEPLFEVCAPGFRQLRWLGARS
ncbi:MAG: TIGR02270 family protein [Gammaproteobacteria bacterium]|nr:TIGR02270 family protein [Gammaproteobacteria bacterium]